MLIILTWSVVFLRACEAVVSFLSADVAAAKNNKEAEDKVDRLCDLVRKSLLRYKLLGEQLASIEPQPYETTPAAYGSAALQPDKTDSESAVGSNLFGVATEIRVFAFEEVLMTSRPYRHTSRDGSDTYSISLYLESLCSRAWSVPRRESRWSLVIRKSQ
jgi:hypothetical protein